MFPIAFHPIFKYHVPEGHRFPMDKYELLPLQLLREGIAEESDFFSPEPMDMPPVYAAHDRAYADRTDDNAYLALLRNTLPGLVERVKPDFIFYQAGVDVLASDKLGRLSCTIDGCRQRDEIVLHTAHKHGIPVQCSMGGGYSPQLKTIIEAYANTYRVARQL